ncbi:MAG: hypothetical protein WBC02_09640 [Candidatus Aminicenantaceae bacterium]
MKKPVVRTFFFCLMIGIFLALTIPLSAEEEFRARLLTVGGPTQDKMVSIAIIIEDYTTVDEVRQFQQILYKSGTAEFLKAFHKANKGVIRIKSARGLNVYINAAQSRKTENGRKILVFAERQSWDVGTSIRISGKYLYMAVELEIDNNWKVTGKFYKAANIELSAKGTIDIESYETPMMLIGVRKVK